MMLIDVEDDPDSLGGSSHKEVVFKKGDREVSIGPSRSGHTVIFRTYGGEGVMSKDTYIVPMKDFGSFMLAVTEAYRLHIHEWNK